MPARKRSLSRSPPSSAGPSKRSRISLEDFFFDRSREVAWFDIERTLASRTEAEDDHRKWIQGEVQVVFFDRKDVRSFKLRSPDKELLSVTVSCYGYDSFKMVIGAQVKMSLRGARLVKSTNTAAASRALSFSLAFPDAAAMRIVKDVGRPKEAEIIDVWDCECLAAFSREPLLIIRQLGHRKKNWVLRSEKRIGSLPQLSQVTLSNLSIARARTRIVS